MTLPVPLELADDLYLLACDGVRGNPRLHPRALQLGLASALVAELLLSGWATADGGHLTAIDLRTVANDDFRTADSPPIHPLWRVLVGEPWRLPLRTWLDAYGPQAPTVVIERLISGGHLHGRKPVAVNMNTAGWPLARLRGALRRGSFDRWQDVVLLAIAEAAGLGGLLLDDLDPDALAFGSQARAELHRYPDFAELAGVTAAAVGGSVLTR